MEEVAETVAKVKNRPMSKDGVKPVLSRYKDRNDFHLGGTNPSYIMGEGSGRRSSYGPGFPGQGL